MNKTIAIIKGDGIGPEIVDSSLLVLNKIEQKFNHNFDKKFVDMGGVAIDKFGVPLPEETEKTCVESDSVLLGAVGGDKWNDQPSNNRPEKGLLNLRAAMGVYSNNRPAKIWQQLSSASPLKEEIIERGIDFLIVRELIGGIYFGDHNTFVDNGVTKAYDVMPYDETEIERILRVGFEMAQKRSGKLTVVQKSNVLDTSRLWLKVAHSIEGEYSDVKMDEMLVDNAAMQIVRDPSQFDVIVTENMFGDILSDEASMITGSIGMIPSSSLGATKNGLYEPIHGSAPDIAGQDIANPIGTILSVAMMLKYSFDLDEESKAIEDAVAKYLNQGYRTVDIMSEGCEQVGCQRCGELVASFI